MRIRTREAALCLSLTLAACSVLDDFRSGLRITVEDAHQRLGRPPWKIAAFNPYLGPEERFALWAKGRAAPGKAYVVLPSFDDQRRLLDLMIGTELHFGLALPALRPDGYFLARIAWPSNEAEDAGPFDGTAHFCRWGEIAPEPGGETVDFRARFIRKGKSWTAGWEYQVAVRVPGRRAGGST